MDVKYKTIYDSIKDKILNKEYPANSKIPDEISLCKEYNCSRMTMKKALDLLVQEGLLYRKRGQGSFVMSSNNSKGKSLFLKENYKVSLNQAKEMSLLKS